MNVDISVDKLWIKKFDDVCFRDKESYNMFKKLDNTIISTLYYSIQVYSPSKNPNI